MNEVTWLGGHWRWVKLRTGRIIFTCGPPSPPSSIVIKAVLLPGWGADADARESKTKGKARPRFMYIFFTFDSMKHHRKLL